MNLENAVDIVETRRNVGSTQICTSTPRHMLPWRSSVLMIHGAYHDLWAFDPWRRLFATAGWSVEALSLRGRQRDLGNAVDLADFANAVVEVVAGYPSPPILIGHSMGGLLALKAAEVVGARAIVLVASVGPGQLGAHDPTNTTVDYGPEYEREFDDRHISRDMHRWVADKLVVESGRALHSLRTGSMTIDTARVRCPVLAMGARQDQTRVHPADKIAEAFGGDVWWFDEARHDLMLESKSYEAGNVAIEWLIRRVGESAWP
jgi:pimeloyl-ACP methyl ester carboxylesterase